MPIITSATINSLIPKEAKTIKDGYHEISQTVTCKIREMSK
jgi:hypothetical protein